MSTTKLTFNESTRAASNAPKINSSLLLTTSTTSNSAFQHTTAKLNNLSVDTTTNVVDTDEKEKKIIAEFVHLLDKSKQLFNGLR